jgi:LEA14-like dessication related protein
MRRLTAPSALVAALAAAVQLAGCAAVGELAKSAFEKPTLRFVDVAVERLDFEGATLAFDFRLVNPNGFGLTLGKVAYGLAVDGREVARGEIEGGLRIPASGEVPVRFTATLPYREVSHLLELVERGGSVPYTLSGVVGVKTPVGLLELPVSHSGQAPLPGLPGFRFAGVDVRMAGLTDLELDVQLEVHNPNPFPLPPGQLRYTLTLDGQPVASAELHELKAVASGAQGRVTVPVRLSLRAAGRVLGALRGGGADLRLNGQARLGALPVPVDVSGKAGGK